MTKPARLAPIAAVLAAALCACAETHENLEPTKIELAPSPAPPPLVQSPAQQQTTARRPFDASAWVAMQDGAIDCEKTARQMKRDEPEEAWQALKACIERGKFARGAKFVQIEPVLANWATELTARPDSATMLAQLVANRGGDPEGDLLQLQDSRIPLFTLNAALQQPTIYKGRLLLIRAQVRDVRGAEAKEGGVTMMLDESAFQSVHSQKNVVTSQGYTPTAHSSGYYESRFIVNNDNNVARPTGRVALGRMPEADPFLQPQRDFLFLARFDGTTKESAQTMAVVTLIKYFVPGKTMVQ
jgi:hypothetical protein